MVFSSLIVLNAATGSAFTALQQVSKSPGRSRSAAVDYRRPERKYENVKLEDAKLGDVTVWVEKQLKADAPAVAKAPWPASKRSVVRY